MNDPASRVGMTIRNKWTLERLLGSGGMAAVYVGIHRIGRRDALKILHPRAAQSKEICERFEREAHAANRFRHPGAVEIRDIDVAEDGAPFLVMELLEGESLAHREERLGFISIPELLGYMAQVLDTLAAAHAQGIVHRDIKPGNLHVIAGDRIKVLDFGLARIRQDSVVQVELTKMGLVLGTTPYMPPEQARGRPIDARADLFAVGATMFRLLTGRHVHHADSHFDLLMKMAKEPAPPLAAVAPTLPRSLCQVVDRALAFDRDQRYPDAGRMLEDVRALLADQAPSAARAPSVAPATPAPVRQTEAPSPALQAGSPSPASPAEPASGGSAIPVTWVDPPSGSGDSIQVDISDISFTGGAPAPTPGKPPRSGGG